MSPVKETYMTNQYIVRVIRFTWLALCWVMKRVYVTKLTDIKYAPGLRSWTSITQGYYSQYC
jgi:hypothetical protein